MHVDFLRVSKDSQVSVQVPVHFENEEKSPGLKRGGALNIVRHEVELNVSADSIPEFLTVDLTGLNIGDTVHISDIKLPAGATPVISDRDFTVATIAGRVMEAEGEAAEAEGEAEA
jgi:large subunit ribosomal protein L25